MGDDHQPLAHHRTRLAIGPCGRGQQRRPRFGDGTTRTGLSGLDNDTLRADRAPLGIFAVTGTGAASGSFRVDGFESQRATGPIGSGTALPDELFSDNLETGDLRYWTSTSGVSVTTGAALVGTQGLTITTLSNTTARFVADATPDNETSYRARFYFDPNTLTMANNSAHLIFVGYITTTTTDVLRLELQRVAAGYQLRTQIRDNGSTWQSSSWVTISEDPHALELAWTAGASGKIDWWIDGNPQPATPTANNSTRRLGRVRLGAVSGLDATTNGTAYIDACASRRTGAIGLAGGALAVQAIAYAYDPLYRLTGATYGNGLTFGYQYDAAGRPLSAGDNPRGLTDG